VHPLLTKLPYEDVVFPELYREELFVRHLKRDSYLYRQAASALYLSRFYREWARTVLRDCDSDWLFLTSPLLHLYRVHELQASEPFGDEIDEIEERESWYLSELYRRLGVEPDDHALRLAVHGVMYLRGLSRYRQIAERVVAGPPWETWERDAELNARLCFDVLWDMAGWEKAKGLVARASQTDREIIQEVEKRKEVENAQHRLEECD